jgi:hypothetical protein
MFWYVLQLIIIVSVTYAYATQIAPHALLGHIVLFAFLLAYAVTWVLSKLVDLLRLIIRISTRGVLKLKVRGFRASQSPRHATDANVRRKNLVKPRNPML